MPDGWATGREIETFTPTVISKPLYSGARSLSADTSREVLLTGGDNGVAGVYNVSTNQLVQELEVGSGAITDAVWIGSRIAISTSSGIVKLFDNGAESSTFSCHAGKVTALAVHPSGDILASVGVDKSYILYDLENSTQATQVYTNSGKRSRSCVMDSVVELTPNQSSNVRASILTDACSP